MAITKTRDILKVNIIETNPDQVRLAQYLRGTKNISAQLMTAAEAFYYSYALAVDREISDAAVELAVSESVLLLSSQINRVLNFHRIDRGIVLPTEFLTQCGLVRGTLPSTPTVAPPERTVVTLPAVAPKVAVAIPEPSKPSPAPELAEEIEEDRVAEVINGVTHVGGLKLSSAVSDFLNGR
jgi:hypothetical protein